MTLVSRRQMLKLFGASAAGAMAVPLISRAQSPGSFLNPLLIPPLEQGVMTQDEGGLTRRRFELTLQQGKTRFLPDTDTNTLGINGSYTGAYAARTSGRHS